jgi:acid stress-induced BolA-like protein IbaG/YrbA
MVTSDNIVEWIEAGLPESRVPFSEGDGHHFEAVVVSKQFEGKNTVMRHRLVYQALGHRMEKEIHALSFKTMTPEEYKNAKVLEEQ